MNAMTENPQPGADNLSAAEPAKQPRRWRRLALMLSLPVLLAIGAAYAYLTGGRYVGTDDAYVKADKINVSSDVAGRVIEIRVRENQYVKAGDLLYRLDDSSYRIALDRTRAQLASARMQIEALRASYREKLTDLKSAQDTLAYQTREFMRQQQLLASGVAAKAKFDEAQHKQDVAQQQVASVRQQIANILASLNGDPDIAVENHPLVTQARAAVDQAALDLAHTTVYAPSNGMVAKLDRLQVGQYLNAAAPAFALVATDHLWIEANFKETDLTYMRPGQRATIEIDSFPDHDLTARVESIGAGTGAEFSVLPPQNATGNWVKVVQRVPVRLIIDAPATTERLRIGMSTNVEVDTRHVRHEFAWIRSAIGAPVEPQDVKSN
jgi:membrane fusion protein (multidrug efflux system)